MITFSIRLYNNCGDRVGYLSINDAINRDFYKELSLFRESSDLTATRIAIRKVVKNSDKLKSFKVSRIEVRQLNDSLDCIKSLAVWDI